MQTLKKLTKANGWKVIRWRLAFNLFGYVHRCLSANQGHCSTRLDFLYYLKLLLIACAANTVDSS